MTAPGGPATVCDFFPTLQGRSRPYAHAVWNEITGAYDRHCGRRAEDPPDRRHYDLSEAQAGTIRSALARYDRVTGQPEQAGSAA